MPNDKIKITKVDFKRTLDVLFSTLLMLGNYCIFLTIGISYVVFSEKNIIANRIFISLILISLLTTVQMTVVCYETIKQQGGNIKCQKK